MPRPSRIQFKHAMYHISARGNWKRSIFRSDQNKKDLLGLLNKAVRKYAIRVYAYCIMPNHYHALIETPRANISSSIQYINGQFGRLYSKKINCKGHVFQGRFHSSLIANDEYFLEAIRYIVLNPVRAGIVSHPAAWQWSSYRSTADYCRPNDWLDIGDILRLFSYNHKVAVGKYRDFVLGGL